VAAVHVAGVRGDPCGTVRWTALVFINYWMEKCTVKHWNSKYIY